jgi:hypothetical protein
LPCHCPSTSSSSSSPTSVSSSSSSGDSESKAKFGLHRNQTIVHHPNSELCCPQCRSSKSQQCRHQEKSDVTFDSGQRWIYQCQSCECLVKKNKWRIQLSQDKKNNSFFFCFLAWRDGLLADGMSSRLL